MKTPLLAFLGFWLATALPAQLPAEPVPPPMRTAAELTELLGPIALYPDALVSLILPASTFPSDIVMGARYVAAGGDLALVEGKPWDASVKALTRYPETLQWLDENLEWTTQVGDAFIEQPAQVMEAIQELRAKANALGNLIDTPQQTIVRDETIIRIIPAQPEYIYEPRYDPEVVYYERPTIAPFLYFSAGYRMGSWLNYDCDWHHRRLYRGDWHGGWDYRRDHDHDHSDRERDHRAEGNVTSIYINNNLVNRQEWRPDPARHRAPAHRAIVERGATGGNLPSPTRILEGEKTPLREHHLGIARPKLIPIPSLKKNEEVRRAETQPPSKSGILPGVPMAQENKPGKAPQGRFTMPSKPAPGIAVDERRGGKGRERVESKIPGKISDFKPGADLPTPGKDSKARGKGPTIDTVPIVPRSTVIPKPQSVMPRSVEPRNVAPKPSVKPKPQAVMPRSVEPRNVAPKPNVIPRPQSVMPRSVEPRNVAPKPTYVPKSQAVMPRSVEPRNVAPKHNAPPRQQVAPRPVESRKVVPRNTAPPRQQIAPRAVMPKPAAAKPQSGPTKDEDNKRKGKGR